MDVIHQGLRLFNKASSSESKCSCRCTEQKTTITRCLLTEWSLTELFGDLEIEFQPQSERVMAANMRTWEPEILGRIKDSQKEDPKLVRLIDSITDKLEFRLVDGVLYCHDRLCIPDVQDLKNEIMVEAHHSRYAIHQRSTKMYQNLRSYYWWNNMKKDIPWFVSKCLVCQQMKVEHQKSAGLLQSLKTPEQK